MNNTFKRFACYHLNTMLLLLLPPFFITQTEKKNTFINIYDNYQYSIVINGFN